MSFGAGTPSRDFTSEDLFSSPMMSMHSSMHSSQMNTVGPEMSLRTSFWLLPQNVQWSVLLVSLPPALFISVPRLEHVPQKWEPVLRKGQAQTTSRCKLSQSLTTDMLLRRRPSALRRCRLLGLASRRGRHKRNFCPPWSM